MATPLLQTKLYIPPPRPNLVPRPRLLERLNAGLRGKFTLISAPAGFGKTTLLSEWIDSCERPVAWLSLDEGDNDPARFLTYLVAALQTIEATVGKGALSLLQAPQPPPTEAVLTPLINEIAALPDGFVLVLDDYHLIERQSIHDALTFLLDHMPPQMHLVIAGRMDPPLPLARLRARGQLTELRAADLSFTPDKAAAFLNDIMGLGLSPADVAALDARTEGWIAGLQMAALSMQGRDDLPGFVAAFTGSHRYILDHLTEEVLEQQPERVRRFLLETSILDRLCGPLCDAVTDRDDGQGDGQAILEELERANLFIRSLDHERRWFRYHRLFADLLQRRLSQAEPDRIPDLHRRAFGWCKAHALHQEALGHALAAQDFERAADLIETVGGRVIARGGVTTVQNWIAALPEGLVRARPGLCVLHAWTLTLTNRWDEVEPRLLDAERAMAAEDGAAQDPEVADLRGQIAAIRAYDARRHHDFARSIRLLQEAQTRLAPDNRVIRTTVSQSLGQAYLFTGDLNKAADAFSAARSLGETSGNELAGMVATGQQAAILIAQGQLHPAADLCRAAIDRYLAQHDEPSPVLCHPYAFLGQVLYEWNHVGEAVAHLAQSVLWSDQIGYGPSGAPVHLMTALLEWVQLAQEMRGDPILRRMPAEIDAGIDAVDINAWRVRLWLARGDLAVATRWAEVCRSGERPPTAWPLYRDLALARVLAARRKPDQALDILSQVRRAARATGGQGCLIQALALEALLHQAGGRVDRALIPLEEALTLAAPAGYVRTFVDEGPAMEALLRKAAVGDVNAEYASKLLSAFPRSHGRQSPVPGLQATPLVEPLSQREVEVLSLMAAGLSNQEIADRLILALGTVKKHSNNIYGKLGVRSRIQAILRAAELDLIPPR